MKDDEWTLVSRRKAGKLRSRPVNNHDEIELFDETEIETKYNQAKDAMIRSKMLLVNSETLKQVIRVDEQFNHLRKAVVFGLGSLSSQRSRLQLAFVLHLVDLCPSICEKEIFDPAFTETDKSYLRKLGFSLLSSNRDCRYVLTCSSLVFMPHMEIACYENFLVANEENPFLTESILLCNSLSKYVNHCSEYSRHHITCETIRDVTSREWLKEIELQEEDMKNSFAFNDMSVHYFVNNDCQ